MRGKDGGWLYSIESILLHAERGSNDHRKDAPQFTLRTSKNGFIASPMASRPFWISLNFFSIAPAASFNTETFCFFGIFSLRIIHCRIQWGPQRVKSFKSYSSPSKPLSVILKSLAWLCQRLYREHVLELLELMLRYLSCLSLNNLKFRSSFSWVPNGILFLRVVQTQAILF